MSEEIENETTGHFNNRFYCFVYWLRRTTPTSTSSDTAAIHTGTTPHTVTSTPPTLPKASPFSGSPDPTANNGTQGLS